MSRVKPILFNIDMVRMILDGRKTVIRKLIKVPSYYPHFYKLHDNTDGRITGQKNELFAGFYKDEQIFYINGEKRIDAVYYKAPCKPGDVLYVKETWHKYTKRVGKGESCHLAEFYGYKASIANSEDGEEKWRPSIHMPKEAARIWLKVIGVRVERLQDITEKQAKAEGFEPVMSTKDSSFYTPWQGPPVENFKYFWNYTIKKKGLPLYGWNANPWVWVIEFEQCKKPEEI